MTAAPTPAPNVAAYFDVDGTLADVTIVHAYAYVRFRALPPVVRHVWFLAFLAKCGYYVFLDRWDRTKLHWVFYRNYGGLNSAEVRRLAANYYQEVLRPRVYPEGPACILNHRHSGHSVIFVTGSADFFVMPLAQESSADEVFATTLAIANDRFTGDLVGNPVNDVEKARLVREHARARGIDLSRSHAYGDSINDLAMLECVGFPHAVNPDRALAKIAARRGWPVHRWSLSRSPVLP